MKKITLQEAFAGWEKINKRYEEYIIDQSTLREQRLYILEHLGFDFSVGARKKSE